MTRGKRRKDGGPNYPLEQVHTLARLSSIHLTQKARDEAAALLPPSVGLPTQSVRSTLLALRDEHWKFAEENERGMGRCLSDSQVQPPSLGEAEGGDAECQGVVILLSFHDYDDDVPV